MPTYDYVCDACGHAFELFQQMSDPTKRKCPECSKLKLRRLIGTGAGVIFKGSGFYETDYRSASYKKGAESDKKPTGDSKKDAKSPGGSDSGSDSKDTSSSKDSSSSSSSSSPSPSPSSSGDGSKTSGSGKTSSND